MEFTVDIATSDDDAALRRLLRENPIPGAISVSYEREPDFFRASTLLNRQTQVLVARHVSSGAIAGLICRSIRSLFVNGEERLVGYIHGLRVDRRFEGRWLLSRGLKLLRELDQDGAAPFYLVAMIEGNETAQQLFVEKPRRHFPAFREADRLTTLAIQVGARKAALTPATVALRCGTEADIPALVAFLRREGARRQFFPAITEEEFRDGRTLPGLGIQEFTLAWRGGEIVGCIALWDQSGCKQMVVQGYSGHLRWARHPYNLLAWLSGFQPLPAPGSPLKMAHAALVCVADEGLFGALLRAVYNQASARRYHTLALGLSARDPLLAAARRYRHVAYQSRLYSVSLKDGEHPHEQLDQRIPYVEVASL